jgi:hypothetical protein
LPTFAEIPLDTLTDTMYRPGTTPVSAEYAEYIRRLTPGNAGILDVAPQENIGVVRARLSAAARQLKMPLKIRREDRRIFFWVDGGTP